MTTIKRHAETGSAETREAGIKLMRAKDKLTAARADHGSIDEHAADLDVSELRGRSKAKVSRLKDEHDLAETCVECELEGEPEKAAVIHHGRRDVLMALDEDDDDKLVVEDLDDEDDEV
jgi:hypothetical protein